VAIETVVGDSEAVGVIGSDGGFVRREVVAGDRVVVAGVHVDAGQPAFDGVVANGGAFDAVSEGDGPQWLRVVAASAGEEASRDGDVVGQDLDGALNVGLG